jgi:hypothetical protein
VQTSNITANAPALSTSLGNIEANNGLRVLLDSVRAALASDPKLAEIYNNNAGGIELANLGSVQRTQVAYGIGLGTPALVGSPLPTDVGQIDRCTSTYEDLAQRLAQLKSFLESVSKNYSTVLGKLTADEQRDLRALSGDLNTVKSNINWLVSDVTYLRKAIVSRGVALDELTFRARYVGVTNQTFQSSTVGNADLYRMWYVAADVGFVAAPTVGAMLPYIGTNIYFRPVNKDAPLDVRDGWLLRLSITIGATLGKVRDLGPSTTSFLFDRAFMFGGGIRVTQSIRVGSGVLFFREQNRNPLISAPMISMTEYFALSLDIDMKDFSFKSLFSGLFP